MSFSQNERIYFPCILSRILFFFPHVPLMSQKPVSCLKRSHPKPSNTQFTNQADLPSISAILICSDGLIQHTSSAKNKQPEQYQAAAVQRQDGMQHTSGISAKASTRASKIQQQRRSEDTNSTSSNRQSHEPSKRQNKPQAQAQGQTKRHPAP